MLYTDDLSAIWEYLPSPSPHKCNYMRGFKYIGVDDRVNCTDMEGEGQCSRSGDA